jgi:hypothetical protein
MRGATEAHARGSRWLTVVALVSILGWALPALVMLGKGFAVQDEGTYVLSYRFWQTNPYFVSGAQYVYGPVFEALGESIPLLRVLRLVMVVGFTAWFAVALVSWLERQRPGLLPASRGSLVLLLVATGGMSYLWSPLTPGYHDLTAECCLALVALLLPVLGAERRPRARLRAWVPMLTGVVGVVLVVTKWTAFPVPVLTAGAAGWCLTRASRRAAVRYGVLVGAGVALALVACQVFLVPLGRLVHVTWKVSSLNAVGSHGLPFLLRSNLSSTLSLLVGALLVGLPLLAALFAARAAERRGGDRRADASLVSAAVLTTLVLPFVLGWHGGGDRGRVVVAVALAGLIAAALAAVLSHPGSLPGGSEGRLLAVVLVVVPVLQAAGTNVPFLYVVAGCLAMWVALVLMLVTRAGSPRWACTAVLVDLAVLVVATAMIAGSTTLMSPFKTASVSEATTLVPQLGVRLDPPTARQYDALGTALAPYVVAGQTPVLTLDQLAGLTYLLGGVPAGSTWTDAASPSRTTGILRMACDRGDVRSAPVLVVDRPVDAGLARALAGCGFDYPADYRPLAVPSGPPGLRVFLPRSSQ